MAATYATVANVTARLGTQRAVRLTTEDGAVTDDAVIQAATDGAQGEIDSYLSQRFKTPIDITVVTEAVDVLRENTIDVAVYQLAKRRPPPPQNDADARDRAIQWAKDISTGKATLPGADAPASPTSNAPGAVLTSQVRQASRANMAQL